MTLSSEKDLYGILEISSNASKSTIKTAYRRLVRVYHPDLNGGKFADKFKEITQAYEILSDEEKRRNYDILRTARYGYTTKTEDFQTREYKKPEFKKETHEESFSDLLNDFWTGFKKTTESYRKNAGKRGDDAYSEIVLTEEEARLGCVKTVNILHTQVCQMCFGRPFLNGGTCKVCNGKGVQSVHKKLNIKIPKGVKNNSKIRIAGEGNNGSKGCDNGDLYLTVKIENRKEYDFQGSNSIYELPITPFEAVLGATVHVKTSEGNIALKISPNTKNGQKFRLAGLSQNNSNGDMIVTVKIEIPKNLSPQEIALYNQLKTINNTDIRE